MKKLFGARKQEPQQSPITDLSYEVDRDCIPTQQQPKDGVRTQPMPYQPPLQSASSLSPIPRTDPNTNPARRHYPSTSLDANWSVVKNGNDTNSTLLTSSTADPLLVYRRASFESRSSSIAFLPPGASPPIPNRPPSTHTAIDSLPQPLVKQWQQSTGRPIQRLGDDSGPSGYSAPAPVVTATAYNVKPQYPQSLSGASTSAENVSLMSHSEIHNKEKHDKPKRGLFDWLGGEREKEKITRGRTRSVTPGPGTNLGPDGQPWDLTRLMGFVTATASEDWTLLMELCDQASTDSGAKEAAKALSSEIKYADPPAMLTAARLWAIMLRNTKYPFIQQTSSRKFLEAVEDAYNGPDTSPVVRDRLATVIAGASFQFGDKYSSFRSLWKRIKSSNAPTEGVAFDPKDAMLSPPSRRPPKPELPAQDPNYRASMVETIPTGESLASLSASMGQGFLSPPPQQQYHNSIQQIPMDAAPVQFDKDSVRKPKNQRHRLSKMGIVLPEEDMRRLFEECKIAKNNAALLNNALTYSKPEEVVAGGAGGLIREFHNNCMRSQELISTQIPSATAQSDRARCPSLANNPEASESESWTEEEDLLAEILAANQELEETFRMYDEVERLAVAEREEREVQKRSHVETRLDRTQIQHYAEDGSFLTQPFGGGVAGSGSSRSPSPAPPAVLQGSSAFRQHHSLPAVSSAILPPPVTNMEPQIHPDSLSNTLAPPPATPRRPSPARSSGPSSDGGARRSVDIALTRNGANATPTAQDRLDTLKRGMSKLGLDARRTRGGTLSSARTPNHDPDAWIAADNCDGTNSAVLTPSTADPLLVHSRPSVESGSSSIASLPAGASPPIIYLSSSLPPLLSQQKSTRRPLPSPGDANGPSDYPATTYNAELHQPQPLSASAAIDSLSLMFHHDIHSTGEHDKPEHSFFDRLSGERVMEKIAKEQTQSVTPSPNAKLAPDDQPWSLTRLIGFVTATASEDWTLLMDLCDQASNDSGAKEAAVTLGNLIRYAKPPATLIAVRLWAIMLRNSSHQFVQQTSTQKFLNLVEVTYTGPNTSPAVRDRLFTVIAGASYQFGDECSGFRNLWKHIKSQNAPTEGVAFDPKDPMFSPPSRRLPKPGLESQESDHQLSTVEAVPAGKYLTSLRTSMDPGIVAPSLQHQFSHNIQQMSMDTTPIRSPPTNVIPPKEDIQRLLEQCEIAKGNATLLNNALAYAKPEDVVADGRGGLIQEFYKKCKLWHEIIYIQIPWATALSERARCYVLQSNPDTAESESATVEEDLLVKVLAANHELVDVFRVYDELTRLGVAERDELEKQKRDRVETRLDRTQLQYYFADGSCVTEPLGGWIDGSGSPQSAPASPTRLRGTVREPKNGTYGAHEKKKECNDWTNGPISVVVERKPGKTPSADNPKQPNEAQHMLPMQIAARPSATSPPTAPPIKDLGDEIVFDTGVPFDTRGRFCDLFLGEHRTAGTVALKRLRLRGGGGGGGEGDIEILTRQFSREKDVWMTLRHDRVLNCLGTFTRERHLYLVSPFMKNGSLFDWIRSGPHIGLERLRLTRELADALVYLHSSGIVHGDIKSSNVLLSEDMHVQLCDFGLTKLAESATTTTLKGAGTVRWQSPELWTDTPKSFKSDIYAFAMTIVEILTGKIPFATISSDYAVIMAVSMRGERPVPSPGVSPDGKSYANAWDVAARCWHGDIDQRISMAEAVELFAFCTERY